MRNVVDELFYQLSFKLFKFYNSLMNITSNKDMKICLLQHNRLPLIESSPKSFSTGVSIFLNGIKSFRLRNEMKKFDI